ncbi:unnamed protein product [Dibothriocephalus latus]|uniref:Receptor ligand binding region domain-containing protein n=1 Tax=Dibothriocephalus latus TaxID=60516 RepID=A0A3P7NQP5_DIBLA|nr:unnamed protein product [Dibothriocephalus latus]
MKITAWHNPLTFTAIISAILFFLTSPHLEAYGHRRYKLQLVRFNDSETCLDEFKVFNLASTTSYALNYATMGNGAEFDRNAIQEFVIPVKGCSIRDAARNQGLLDALNEADRLASLPRGFTVLIGPALPADCNFVTDWIREGEVVDIFGLYQIQYNCRLNGLVQPSVQVDISNSTEHMTGDLVALSMTIQLSTLVAALNVFLRHYGWQRIAVFYEVSLESLQNRLVAERLQVFFASLPTATDNLEIVAFRSIRWGSQPSWYLQNFTQPVDGKLDSLILLNSQVVSHCEAITYIFCRFHSNCWSNHAFTTVSNDGFEKEFETSGD